MRFKNDDQFKAYLKSESKRLNILPTNAYNTYFSRDLLDKINRISNGEIYAKGSFAEFAHTGKLVRPITDVDITSTNNFENTFKIILEAMKYNPEINNFSYELAKEPYQTSTGIYKILLYANYGKIHHPLSIDFQTDSKFIYKGDYKVINPIFNGDHYFGVCVPTIEEYMAEKLYIVLTRHREDKLNTRLKDFYDIWKTCECNYVANDVEKYFGMLIDDDNKLSENELNTDFIDDDYLQRHQELWLIAKHKYEFLDDLVTYENAVKAAKVLLNHQIEKYKEVKGYTRVRN